MLNKLYRRLKLYLIRLVRSKTGASKIALGLVLGFFPCWYPTFGVGPVLSVGITKLVRGHLPAAIISASIGSFVFPVLFYMNYLTGSWLRLDDGSMEDITLDTIEYEKAASHLASLKNLGMDFTLGAIINSVIFTFIGYFIFKYVFQHYRLHILRWLRT